LSPNIMTFTLLLTSQYYTPSIKATLQLDQWQYEGLKSSFPGSQIIKKIFSWTIITTASSVILPGTNTM